jgi:hypothetical protein
MLLTKPKKINWSLLSMNTNDRALELLLKNPEKIYWNTLSSNKNDIAVKLLLENIDKINWRFFSENSNDKAVNYLLENPDKIVWNNFCSNINIKAFAFLLKNKEKIDWHFLSSNPLIFIYDNEIAIKNLSLVTKEINSLQLTEPLQVTILLFPEMYRQRNVNNISVFLKRFHTPNCTIQICSNGLKISLEKLFKMNAERV